MSMVNVAGKNATSKIDGLTADCVQPNAVDITLGKVFRILPTLFEIDAANNKVPRQVEELFPDENGFWNLQPGAYEGIAEQTVTVGEDEAGYIIPRSSLNRGNVFLTSGLYDSCYSGVCAFCIHVGTGPMRIQKGTRVGQYLTWKAEALHKYNGSYGFGTQDDEKYGVTKYAFPSVCVSV